MSVSRTVLAARHSIGVALLALLLAQWGALFHAVSHADLPAVLHAPLHGGAAAAVHAKAAAVHDDAAAVHDEAAAPRPASEPETQADTHGAGSPVCQLFDHLLLAHTAGQPPLLLPQAQWSTAAPPRVLPPALPCRALQAYDARGPPQA